MQSASFFKERIPGGEETISKIGYCYEYIGIPSYLNSVNNLLSGKLAERHANKTIRYLGSLCTLSSRTSKYLWCIPPLLSSHPWVLTATATAQVMNSLLLASGFALSALSLAVESEERKIPSLINSVKIVRNFSMSYVIAMAILVDNPPLSPAFAFISNIAMWSLFLNDVSRGLLYQPHS